MARPLSLFALPLLSGCLAEPAWEVTRQSGPPDLMPLSARLCFAEDVLPAAGGIEEGIARPAMTLPDGTELQRVVSAPRPQHPEATPGVLTRFESPCALQDREPDFIMQVQRALAVRGLYGGPINGAYDPATKAAVAAFQAPFGLASGELSTEAARALGLVTIRRDG
ncbi:peptidoglycan-binding domain-containing protein [Jannaschia seohaensis]|uniref:Peptidoglycan binding domain-containing protein n=1 Tax=Jannaschia seohaensis TaxID=475081 RepID=A0A2Y9AW23_9RHOB|nr:peptidoglycan-binding domain-containing protein [Jannaschia seohaensis]PWJ18212.1 putative peptidoglycan binding protein [Jannaschia seohaensis]SSA46737.1 Putative peptidoglycan binding domain-containing protein [Jannaschia seohaensis]